MKISDLFGRSNVYGNSKADGASRAEDQQSGVVAGRISTDEGSDRTTISSKARVLSQIGDIRDEADSKDASRIADLKKRVESGDYNVSSNAVAEKLVAFFNERS